MVRTVRASAACAVLPALVLGLLLCAAGVLTGAGTAPGPEVVSAAASVPGGGSGAGPALAVSAGATVPGCDQGHTADGAARPATPPRPSGFGELLPALTRARETDGPWDGDQDIRDLPSGPAPPERVPPSPMELSILRV
ncbi:hypothetical protein ACWGIN_17945 [Streptomyces sp. NPDC054861]